jgi:hypothetical protein
MDARKNPAISLRKPEWGQDNQQLPHKASISQVLDWRASILQVLDWRVGNTINKANHHFLNLFFFFTIYLFLMSMCSLPIFQHVFVNPTYFI